MTSNLPSNLNDFNEVAQLIQACISSKNISVFPGIKLNFGFLKVIFFIIVSISKPLSNISKYCLFKTKLISTILL